ncbi:uncharacterized protein LDX57_004372 [Aspergillus melleus]|uniref:uncharacterized protein n=1 Tax=Aspergillus melleus TaxID=138277 RepID=UPI001E8EA641|nr:uncharacterized protein LDX57_004372 [Aspergillus melleus]KAH8426639.1 hypothetical protein LDX57_004372 [Aspergillus melleus]
MRDFWKVSSSWLKPKSRYRNSSSTSDEDHNDEEQHNLLPPKRSRRQTWLMGDGLRRSSKSRPSSIALDGLFNNGLDAGTTSAAGAGDGRNKRASTYLEFLSGDSSHSSGEKVEFRDPTNVRYSSFFDHMVSWDRFM